MEEKKDNPYLFVVVVVVLFLLAIPPVVVFSTKLTQAPKAETVSPLSEASSVASVPPAGGPTPQGAVATKVYAPSDYLYVSQRYFSDAQTLSQKRQQTDEDKKEIIGKLQQAIDTISEGISLYPKRSELWTQRANIYTAIQGIAPLAGKAAASDLEHVQRLTSHKEQISPSLQGLELVKDQQALRQSSGQALRLDAGQASRDVLVAAPDETTSPYKDSKESSAFSGTATMPAGQTSLTIENIHVTDAGPIYVVPMRQPADQTNATLSVISKQTGKSFTVTLDNAQSTDVPFQYWVTK